MSNESLMARVRRALQIDNSGVDESNRHLFKAFPAPIRNDVQGALAALPFDGYSCRMNSYSVRVRGEELQIPHRVYHEISKISHAQLNTLQSEILHCVLTRHSDGRVRQKSVERIVASKSWWIPAYVVQLAGEYVVEILQVIERNLDSFDEEMYTAFLKDNPEFFAATAQRIESYWDCYYRETGRSNYPGFRILGHFRNLVRNQ